MKKRTILACGAAAVLTLGLGPTAPTAASAEEINVLLFGMPYTRGLQEIADQFEAETGIKANVDVVGQDVFESRITLNFTGGAQDVDVVHAPVIQIQRWVEAGWLAPLSSQINAMADKDDILSGPLQAYEVGGETYALPFFAETGLMAYRSDLIDAAPETWADVKTAAGGLDSDIAGLAMRVAPGQGFNMFVFPMIMRAYGGKFFEDYPSNLTPAINSAETLEALNVYIDLMKNHGPDGIGNFNFSEVAAAAQSGQVAMIVDGTSIVAQTVDPEKSQFAEQFTIALPPGGPEGRSPAVAVHGLGVPAGVEDVDGAFKFIEWATSTGVLTQIALNNPYPDFTRASVAANADVVAKYSGIQEDFLDLRVQALNLAIGHYRPLIPTWPEIGAAVGENINAAVNGVMSPEEALAAAEEEMNFILNN